jgi:hypothetical protein
MRHGTDENTKGGHVKMEQNKWSGKGRCKLTHRFRSPVAVASELGIVPESLLLLRCLKQIRNKESNQLICGHNNTLLTVGAASASEQK